MPNTKNLMNRETGVRRAVWLYVGLKTLTVLIVPLAFSLEEGNPSRHRPPRTALTDPQRLPGIGRWRRSRAGRRSRDGVLELSRGAEPSARIGQASGQHKGPDHNGPGLSTLVEMAGIEPASACPKAGLLRAQPEEVFLGPFPLSGELEDRPSHGVKSRSSP